MAKSKVTEIATKLIEEFGDAAPDRARARVDSYSNTGYEPLAEQWRRIEEAVKLQLDEAS